MVVGAAHPIRLSVRQLCLNGIRPIAHFIEPCTARGTSAMQAVLGCPAELLEGLPLGRVSQGPLAVISVREDALRAPLDRMHDLKKFDRLSR